MYFGKKLWTQKNWCQTALLKDKFNEDVVQANVDIL